MDDSSNTASTSVGGKGNALYDKWEGFMRGNCYKRGGIWGLLFEGDRDIRRDDGGALVLMILGVGVKGLPM